MKRIIIDNISTDYFITKDGKCFNERTNKWLKGQVNYKNGYLSYNLKLPLGRTRRFYAHRLVALTYLSNPLNKKEINHKDGNKLNNCVDNLEWVTSKENKQHALERELYKYKHVFCFTKDKKLIAKYLSISEASRASGVSKSLIQQELLKDKKALSGGFYWSYDKSLGDIITYKNNGKAKQVNQYSRDGKFIMSYPSTGTAARALGCNSSHIGECCRGKIKAYKGFVWRYSEDIVSPSEEISEGIASATR